MPYPVLDASAWSIAGLETDGQTQHVWLHRPGDDRPWLYKAVTRHEGWQQGEDWVERVASAIALELEIPHARVELARRGSGRGCLVRDVKEHQWQWYAGADLLAGFHGPEFDPRDRRATGHNLESIEQVLRGYSAPVEWPTMSAYDCFAGYLMLDALIANRDRHPRNWAVMDPPPGSSAIGLLTPSFDHASGLGFGLRDEERAGWLASEGVAAWASRGSAKSFEHQTKPWPTLVDVAVSALQTCSAAAREHWSSNLEGLADAHVAQLVDEVPGLSEVAAKFSQTLMRVNRIRLLERLR